MEIEKLHNIEGNQIYPITHQKAVLDDDNKPLDQVLKPRPPFQKVTDEEMDSMIENGTWAAGVIYYTLEED